LRDSRILSATGGNGRDTGATVMLQPEFFIMLRLTSPSA
jgi:hypothetical protein